MNTGPTDFAQVFARLAAAGQREETVALGGVNVRMVRVAGGSEGRWDGHAHTAETVVVWRGDFTVEFRDHVLTLSAGQCCVVSARGRAPRHVARGRKGGAVPAGGLRRLVAAPS